MQDTIIVQGYGLNNNDAIPVMKKRVKKALELQTEKIKAIILTGGVEYKQRLFRFRKPESRLTEAAMMAKLLKQEDKKHKKARNVKIILEEKSIYTFFNAFYSLKLMKAHGLKNAHVITSKGHKFVRFFFYLNKFLLLSKAQFKFNFV